MLSTLNSVIFFSNIDSFNSNFCSLLPHPRCSELHDWLQHSICDIYRLECLFPNEQVVSRTFHKSSVWNNVSNRDNLRDLWLLPYSFWKVFLVNKILCYTSPSNFQSNRTNQAIIFKHLKMDEKKTFQICDVWDLEGGSLFSLKFQLQAEFHLLFF